MLFELFVFFGRNRADRQLFLPLCVLLWPRLRSLGQWVLGALASGAVILMSGLRIAAGGHFLSDVVMSILFSALTTLFLYRVLAISRHRHLFTGDAVSADTISLWRNGRHAVLARVRRWWPKIKAATSACGRPARVRPRPKRTIEVPNQ